MSSPYYYLVAAVRPPPRYLSRFSTHVNACSLIFLGSLFLAFVSPLPTPPPLPPARYVTFSVFLFGMYARYPIRDPFYLVSILSFSGARKVHSSGVSRFRAFPLFRRVRVYHLLLSLSFSLFIYPPSLSLLLLTLPSPDSVLCSSNSWHFVTSPVGDPRKYDTLDSLPLPTLIQHAARERRTARSSGPVNGYGRCSLEHEDPPVKQYSAKFL